MEERIQIMGRNYCIASYNEDPYANSDFYEIDCIVMQLYAQMMGWA